MSDTILSGDFTVYYLSENRQKRIEYTGSGTTYSVNDLYSALQDLCDELTQLDDGTPMSAQTPTEYTIGIIDTGDADPWFIDDTSVEYLTGGALKTASWDRVTTSNTGIVKFAYTVGGGTDFAQSDKGKTVTHSVGGDSGTLLHFITDGSNGTAWVRPDSSAAANDWDSTGTNVNVTGGTGASLSQDAAASSGESLWANIYTLGTIEDNTHMYVNQDGTVLTASEATTDWWSDGHIDILVKVKDVGVEIDEAVVQVFARQATKSYAYFETDLTAGGRNPIPLQTGDDLSNPDGYRQMVLTDASDNFTVGEIIEDDTDSTKQGVITASSGTAPNITVQYYLVGDPLTDFQSGDGQFTGQTSSETASAVNPTNVNGAASSSITITHGSNETYDIDEDDTNENYSIVIDCNSQTLDEVYERCQYITRRGETSTTSTDGIQGQIYIGSDYRLIYNTLTGTISEGAEVTQVTSGATGTVVAHNTTDKILILRNSRGTFNTTNNVEVDGSNYVTMTSGTATAITPLSAAPFGTYLGGVFFAAPGVVLTSVAGADATNYQLVDDNNNVVNPPTKVTVQVTNLRADDRVAVFRLSGGSIDKAEYSATAQAANSTTIVAGASIVVDTPGKSTGGTVVVVDDSADVEYPIRYASWSGTTFTLAHSTGTSSTGTNTTTFYSTAQDFSSIAKVGDLFYNNSQTDWAWITAITGTTRVDMYPAITGQSSNDNFELNVLPTSSTTSDNLYVPLLWRYEGTGTDGTPGSEGAILTYSSNIDARVVVRNASTGSTSATVPMIPYTADVTVTNNGLSNAAIRTKDTIKS